MSQKPLLARLGAAPNFNRFEKGLGRARCFKHIRHREPVEASQGLELKRDLDHVALARGFAGHHKACRITVNHRNGAIRIDAQVSVAGIDADR